MDPPLGLAYRSRPLRVIHPHLLRQRRVSITAKLKPTRVVEAGCKNRHIRGSLCISESKGRKQHKSSVDSPITAFPFRFHPAVSMGESVKLGWVQLFWKPPVCRTGGTQLAFTNKLRPILNPSGFLANGTEVIRALFGDKEKPAPDWLGSGLARLTKVKDCPQA